MKTLFAVVGIAEMLVGAAFVLTPSPPAALIFGTPLDGPGERAAAGVLGVVLAALGLAFWRARDDHKSPAAGALIAALLVYNAGVAVLLATSALIGTLSAPGLWPAVGFHAGLAAWGVWAVRKRFF